MNRRSFFRALGLGAVSVAGVAAVAKAASEVEVEPVYTAEPLNPGSPFTNYAVGMPTSQMGSHTHSISCHCGLVHHGCPLPASAAGQA